MLQQNDLALISTKDLIDEIVKRHDGMVIAGIKFNTQTSYVLTKHWSGNHFVCLGVIEDMKHQINRQGENNFIKDK